MHFSFKFGPAKPDFIEQEIYMGEFYAKGNTVCNNFSFFKVATLTYEINLK